MTKPTRPLLALLFFACFAVLVGCDDGSGEAANQGSGQSAPAQTALVAKPQAPPTNDQTATATQKRVALIMKTLTNPFFISMEKGARKAEAELGIELVVKTAAQETSIEQQVKIVEDLVRTKSVDAIVIAPGDSRKLIPALKTAQDAGIVVINIDNELDQSFSKKVGLENVPFISVDNEHGAYLSAKYIGNQVFAPTKAVILEGIREASNAQARLAGAQRAFAENSNIEVVASESAEWKIDEAYEVTKQLFADNPDISLIFAANDMMALGAIRFLRESEMTDVRVAAFDALEEAKKAILDGWMTVTIDQHPEVQGYEGVRFAVQALEGADLPARTMVDVMVVSQENLK
ncbi:MAG: substrate-binding domain-containing protein [Rhodospirillaceae bacterium]